MNKSLLALGIILAAVGIATYIISSQTDLLGGRTHHTIPLGGLGLTVLGALVAVGGIMAGRPASTSSQFKCSKCGASFGSQIALDQHTKDKHGKQA